MTVVLQISLSFSPLSASKPCNFPALSSSKIVSLSQKRPRLRAYSEKGVFLEVGRGEVGLWVQKEGYKKKRRLVLVKGFGLNGGGGSNNNSGTIRILGNLALAIGLTYLSTTGQLGGVFDAILSVFDFLISLWLLAIIVPVIGLGAFLWWAGRNVLQGTCPNCGNEFQIFKSTVNDEVQLCPYCSTPFSVEGDEFVSDSVKFSNSATAFKQSSDGFSFRSKKGKESAAVVDVEAEIKDVE